MATLTELYEFLEKKQDDKQIDRMFSYDTFSLEERPQARLEIFSWWEIECKHPIKDNLYLLISSWRQLV